MAINKFVILTMPRTGSTLLSKTLDSHPQIFCGGEIFYFKHKIEHPEYQYQFMRVPMLNAKANYVLNLPKIYLQLPKFLNWVYTDNNDGITAKGFKLMYYQTLYLPGIKKYLEKNKVKIIMLFRNDLLRNALSDLRARTTGVYHNEGEIGDAAVAKFKVDIEALQNTVDKFLGMQQKIETMTQGMPSMKISYEDFSDWDNTISKVLGFLDFDKIRLPKVIEKLNPENLQDMISNFDDVKNWAQKNGYEKYISA